MRIFSDLHHVDLYHSLRLLFEDRFGWELYRPIGIDWWHEGYWNVYNHPATAAQYLGLDQAVNHPDNIFGKPLPDNYCLNMNYTAEDGIYYVRDVTHDRVERAVTLEKFKDMEFDILISSMPQHIAPYNKLIQLYQPKAKHIFQVGNAWGHQPGVKNIMASTAPFVVPSDVNVIFYHQEFDIKLFQYVPPQNHTLAHSYVHFMQGTELLRKFKEALPNWIFKTYGAGMEDSISHINDMAKAYINSGWTWHYKPEGDGYGYGVHRAFACGRPLIIQGNFYQGKLIYPMLRDMVNCLDVSKHVFEENVQFLIEMSKPENHKTMCESAYATWRNTVDFDGEAAMLSEFMERLR